jgi:hypothetical protein
MAITALHFFAVEVMPWDNNKPNTVPLPPAVNWINSSLDLLIAGVGAACSLVLFGYYCYEYFKLRAHARASPVRRKFWTVDKVNACLIPLGLAVGFGVLFFMSR